MSNPFGDIVQFASRNRGEGTLIEPRFYHDVLDFLNVTGTGAYTAIVPNSDPDSYKNGEQFPVRITHMVVAPQHAVVPTNEDGIQAIYEPASKAQQLLLRVERYGDYYMNEQFIRASAWHNVQSAQPYNLAAGSVVHRFFQPLVLSGRDSLRVDFDAVFPGQTVFASAAPDAALFTTNSDGDAAVVPDILVQVTGVGMRSGRPYLLAGPARPTTSGGQTIFTVDPTLLQNIGNEPIALTRMTVVANVAFSQTDGAVLGLLPNAQMFRIQVRQQGNGTQAEWTRGPTYPTPITRMPLALFGTELGDAIVHRFPGDGITLDPGEVIRVTGKNSVYGPIDYDDPAPDLNPRQYSVGFAGYLMVT